MSLERERFIVAFSLYLVKSVKLSLQMLEANNKLKERKTQKARNVVLSRVTHHTQYNQSHHA